jgi:hypothetical protein
VNFQRRTLYGTAHRSKRPAMNHTAVRHPTQNLGFVLRFPSLFDGGRGYAFPCDARGEVDIASLSPRARDNYVAATKAVGRDYGIPAVTAANEERWH